MNLTVKTHRSVADAPTCRQLLSRALLRLAPPEEVPPPIQRRLGRSVSLYLPPLLAAEFTMYRRQVAARFPERFNAAEDGDLAADSALVAALIEVELAGRAKSSQEVPHANDNPAVPIHEEAEDVKERRVLQGALLRGLESALTHGQIVFLEGSTGLGKSRVMATAALNLLAGGSTKPVGLCAPTVAGLAHLAAEVRLTAQSLSRPLPPTVMLLGRGQFVSVEKVRALASDLLEALPSAVDADKEAASRAAARDALAWIERGGPRVTKASQALAELCPDLCLLLDDLNAAVPAWSELYEPGDYRLETPAPATPAAETETKAAKPPTEEERLALLDPAERMYRHLHELAGVLLASPQGAPLVLLTQAKLCHGARQTLFKRPGGLPPWRALLVDEAHDLERQMSAACSQELSLLWLRAELRQIAKKGSASTAARATACVDALTLVIDIIRGPKARRLLDRNGLGSMRITSQELLAVHSGLKGAMSALLKALRALCNRKGGAESKEAASARKRTGFPARLKGEQYHRLFNWAAGIEDIVNGVGSVTVTYSPVRRFPSMIVGPRSLYGFFDALWASADAAGLLSATLFHFGKDGRATCGYVQRKLAVDSHRAAEVPPCHASWVWSTPTLYCPTAKTGALLTYPKSVDRAEGSGTLTVQEQEEFEAGVIPELKAWWDQTANHLHWIGDTAKGGTLVLCCSYRDVAALARRLSERPNAEGKKLDASRLVCHKRGVSLPRLREMFVEISRAGKRPIWLATGGAWTGLDLRDDLVEDPAEDFLLTDLAITRLPFGQNRSAEHQARMNRFGFDAEAAETEMMLRQGMGRAVRRPGLKDRRIWIMDGRIVGPRAAYYQRMIGVLLRYSQRRGF